MPFQYLVLAQLLLQLVGGERSRQAGEALDLPPLGRRNFLVLEKLDSRRRRHAVRYDNVVDVEGVCADSVSTSRVIVAWLGGATGRLKT